MPAVSGDFRPLLYFTVDKAHFRFREPASSGVFREIWRLEATGRGYISGAYFQKCSNFSMGVRRYEAEGQGQVPPPHPPPFSKNREKSFFRANVIKFWHFVNFLYIYFLAKMSSPQS